MGGSSKSLPVKFGDFLMAPNRSINLAPVGMHQLDRIVRKNKKKVTDDVWLKFTIYRELISFSDFWAVA